MVVTSLGIMALRPFAQAVDLIDRPGGRKTHHGEVPIVGGLAMFLGIAVGAGLLPEADTRLTTLISACAMLVAIGLIDDRFNVSPWVRLPFHATATLLVIATVSGVSLSFGDAFGTGVVAFGDPWATVAVLIFVVGAVNAFNMLDGMDGLAGAIALVALIAFGLAAAGAGLSQALGIAMLTGAAVVGFLLFNLPVQWNRGNRCFMGDAGSTLLGFILAMLCLGVSQGPAAAVQPVTALWFVAVPIYELYWTIIRRALRGQSPFRADREHLHHLLLDAGFGVRGAFLVSVTLATVYAAFGWALERAGTPEWLSLGIYAAVGAGTVRAMYLARRFVVLVPASWRRELASLQSPTADRAPR